MNGHANKAAAEKPDRRHFAFLLVALMIIGVVAPIAESALGRTGALLTEAAVALSLLVTLWSVRLRRGEFAVAVALLFVNAIGTVVWFFAAEAGAARIAHASSFGFLAILALVSMRAILAPGPVTLDKMIGGLCVYLLIGIAWGELYQLLYSFDASSFSGVGEQAGHLLSWRLNYFSFVTLTTLGYGDILPTTALVQSITVLETLVGQLYLAVLVAALVSAYFAESGRRAQTSDMEAANQRREAKKPHST